ncbi:thiol:disulfide interchange protein DsbA/DsbL [Zophobihabitans entericus]|uniref:Thiol:disulfide interchange protein n=1 Tax=Zophobihabitans entericus TaxID=1635327 RepID=A0A6G9IAC6_9GAMM|nr:thiol:disulfide interchange protein DsbA/DsbL [Zophobihabitans entericus]QIQ20782.1 thiol:disulfide interchange protein DsbA/DsbL [Zophobihabitans entericus]
MKKIVILIVSLFLFTGTVMAQNQPVEGEDYVTRISAPLEMGQKVEVVEFFSYGCPYCAMVEPQLEKWLEQKSDDVIFTRIAIPRRDRWIEYARTFYTLSFYDQQTEQYILPLLYKAIHEEKQKLDDATAMLNWLEGQGIDRAEIEKIYFSDRVTQAIEQGLKTTSEYQVQTIPAIYINGQMSGRQQILLNSQDGYNKVADTLKALVDNAVILNQSAGSK